MVATGELGYVYALRGEPGRGRRLIAEALAFARQNGPIGLEVETMHALARVEELDPADGDAGGRMRGFLERWQNAGGGALLGLGVPLGGDPVRPPRPWPGRGRLRGRAREDRRYDR